MKKMDEMQMSINLKAIKWSWLFTAIALFIWAVYDFVRTHTVSVAFYLLITQNLVYFFVSQISKCKMGDEDGSKGIIRYLTGLVFFLLLFGVLLYFFPK